MHGSCYRVTPVRFANYRTAPLSECQCVIIALITGTSDTLHYFDTGNNSKLVITTVPCSFLLFIIRSVFGVRKKETTGRAAPRRWYVNYTNRHQHSPYHPSLPLPRVTILVQVPTPAVRALKTPSRDCHSRSYSAVSTYST